MMFHLHNFHRMVSCVRFAVQQYRSFSGEYVGTVSIVYRSGGGSAVSLFEPIRMQQYLENGTNATSEEERRIIWVYLDASKISGCF